MVSKYSIPAKDAKYSVIVGWNSAQNTFFGQVTDNKKADRIVLSVGEADGSICLTAMLKDEIADYATIPDDIIDKLQTDKYQVLCDKCGQPIAKDNSAAGVALRASPFEMLNYSTDRHLFPIEGCGGSPSRVRLVQSDPTWKAAYEKLSQETSGCKPPN